MRGLPDSHLPSIADTIELNMHAAKLTNPNVKIVGITVKTSSVSAKEGQSICEYLGKQFNLPCVDPLRDGVDKIVENL